MTLHTRKGQLSSVNISRIDVNPNQPRLEFEEEYLEELKNVAACYGYAPESVDRLLDSGFSTDEIEEFLYEGTMYQ